MITEKETILIKNILGKHYSNTIIDHLDKKLIYDRKYKPFKPDYIQKIVNGTHEHSILEIEIMLLIHKTAQKIKKDAKKREKILNEITN